MAVFLEDSNHLRDALRRLICAVIRRYDLLGFGSVDMRAPIRDDTVAAVGRISASAVADDRVIGDTFCHCRVFITFTKASLGESVSMLFGMRFSWHDALVILNNRGVHDLWTEPDKFQRLMDQTRCDSADLALCKHATAMWRRDKNNAAPRHAAG